MEVLEQQPCISNADTDLKNKCNDNTFYQSQYQLNKIILHYETSQKEVIKT